MEKVFLDTNIFIDLVEKRRTVTVSNFLGYKLFLSPLSVHILTYVYKYRIPHQKLNDFLKEHINFLTLSKDITDNALKGPTSDFEDNVQLHSAAEAEADYFLTSDRKLLDLKFFGKLKIVAKIGESI